MLQKVREIYGHDSAQTKLAKEKLKSLWDELVKVADANKDKRVSEAEFVKVMKDHDPKNNVSWYLDYATFMFKLFDVSGPLLLLLLPSVPAHQDSGGVWRVQRTGSWTWRSTRTGCSPTATTRPRPTRPSKPSPPSPSPFPSFPMGRWTGERVQGKPTVDFPEFRKLWDQYFYSKDKKVPGNSLFGCLA